MKTLIFFALEFPFGKGEAFIENEFPFLYRAFDKVIIVSNDLNNDYIREVPANVTVIRTPYSAPSFYKYQALFKFPIKIFLEELNAIRPYTPGVPMREILPAFLASYASALSANALIDNIVNKYSLDTNQLYIYSFWLSNMTVGLCLYKQKHPQIKAFARAHRWDIYFEFHTPPYLALRKFILANLDACYCISEDGREYLDKMTNQQFSTKLKLSLLGTFNAKKDYSPIIPTDRLKLMSCSSYIPTKRLHLLIKALALIKNLQIEWTHFGAGYMKEETEKFAKEKLISPNIKFRFGGTITNKKLLEYLAHEKIDLFINVSESEGIPVSIMEASSFGIPVIATDAGGTSEIIQNGVNGILLPRDVSPADVAKAIEDFYALPVEEKRRIQKKAFETWQEKFNAEKNYESFINSLMTL